MRRWCRWGLVVAAALCLLGALSGCSATTQVAIDAQPNGTGTVTVTVTLDQAAVAAVGNVASQLQTADLAAAGWTVHGPAPGAGGTTVVSATKPFTTWAQASSIVQEIAGSGSAASRPFQLTLTRHRSFWKTTTVLAGQVDLRCGLGCFGDAGLQAAIGSPTGIDPATAQHDTGIDPTTIFHFGMTVALPGKLHSTNASTSTSANNFSRLQWTPSLGANEPLLAMTETTNSTHVKEVAIAGGAGLLVLLGLVVWWIVHRWRKRRRPQHRQNTMAQQVGT